MEKTIHQGRNIKRFREMLGVKQDALALELGEEWNQRKISLLEQKEVIDPELIEQVAKILKVPADAIKNFDAEAAMVNIQNNYEGSNAHAIITGTGSYYDCNFNPIERWLDSIEENKKLYERLLASEREKVEMLQGLQKK
jgi:transcriptional regulator with XRE-family HTH domain